MEKRNTVEKLEFYRRLLEEAAEDGNSVIKVAKKYGLSYVTLFRWRKHFGSRLKVPAVAPPADLLPVELVSPSATQAPIVSVLSIGGPPPEGGFLLKLRSGHEVRVPSGFNVEELRSLVTALEAAPCS